MAQGATTQKFTTTQHENDEAPKIVWHNWVLPHKNHYHTSCVVQEGVSVVMLAHFRLSVPHNVPHLLPHFATETL